MYDGFRSKTRSPLAMMARPRTCAGQGLPCPLLLGGSVTAQNYLDQVFAIVAVIGLVEFVGAILEFAIVTVRRG